MDKVVLKINRFIFFSFCVMQSISLCAQTRNEFLGGVESCANMEWMCSVNNIEDTDNTGIDDRKERESRQWPFQANTVYYGIPYAFGYADASLTFSNKIGSTNKYIAGRDPQYSGDRHGVPQGYGYTDFTGIDCSALVSRAMCIIGRLTTAAIPLYGIKVEDLNSFQPGDLLNRAGEHVMVYAGGDIDSRINTCHSVTWAFSRSEKVMRTIIDSNISSFVNLDRNIILRCLSSRIDNQLKEYFPYTLFPVFLETIEPGATIEVDNSDPEIKPIGFYVRSKLMVQSATVNVDGRSDGCFVQKLMRRVMYSRLMLKSTL